MELLTGSNLLHLNIIKLFGREGSLWKPDVGLKWRGGWGARQFVTYLRLHSESVVKVRQNPDVLLLTNNLLTALGILLLNALVALPSFQCFL